MKSAMNLAMRSIVYASLTAGLLSVAGLPSRLIAQVEDNSVDQVESQAHQAWRETMHHIEAPEEGCFHASYPSTQWEAVECVDRPAYRSALPNHSGREQAVGNGFDYVAQAASGHLITVAAGSFPTVKGVKWEQGLGGIAGPNEYTLQVNTNFAHTAACGDFTGCMAWQQYVLSTNTPVSLTTGELSGKTEVFIEYWLLNYGIDTGANICPKGFIDGGPDFTGPGDDCVQNTPAVVIYNGQIPITELASLQLGGSAVVNGTDKAVATYGTEAYTATVKDSYTDISSGWNQAEFNIFGNAGGSEAQFNSGVSLKVKLAVSDGSQSGPACVPPANFDGTTGETNNLNLGSCTSIGGFIPYIQFTESN
jgi:hypothetical protein